LAVLANFQFFVENKIGNPANCSTRRKVMAHKTLTEHKLYKPGSKVPRSEAYIITDESGQPLLYHTLFLDRGERFPVVPGNDEIRYLAADDHSPE
jgi:hypothetical protein